MQMFQPEKENGMGLSVVKSKHHYHNQPLFNMQIDDPEGVEIWDVFRGRCFICTKPANTIHEIIPRARGKLAMEKKNRAPVCVECHDDIHRQGVSLYMVARLQEQRKDYLISIGREDYG